MGRAVRRGDSITALQFSSTVFHDAGLGGILSASSHGLSHVSDYSSVFLDLYFLALFSAMVNFPK